MIAVGRKLINYSETVPLDEKTLTTIEANIITYYYMLYIFLSFIELY